MEIMKRMKKIRIPIGELFKKLNIKHINTEYNNTQGLTHDVPCDLFVNTGKKYVKINQLVSKMSKTYTYSLQNNTELKLSDKHIVIQNGKEVLIKDAISVDNIDGNSYKIINTEKLSEEEVVYDFSIPSPNLYCTPDGSIHHNTTIASILFLYDLARLLCLDEPQLHFNLPKSAKIYFTLTNSTLENIEQVNLDPIMGMIRESPFFRSKFNNTNNKASFFIKNIHIHMASRKHSLVGKNVYSASSDEVNQEIQKGGSKNIVTEMYNRINSRFLLKGNKWPGHFSMISSATTEGSLIQTMIDNANEKTDNELSKSDILVVSAPRFEVLKHKTVYSGVRFKIFVGDYQSDPFLINDDSDLKRAKDFDENKIFEVPIEHKGEFDDIYVGIRDVLGMAVSDIRTFLPFKKKIKEAMVLDTCSKDEIVLDENDKLIDYFNTDNLDVFKPGSQKVIGLDIAYAGDRYGLCMLHIHDAHGAGELQEFTLWADFIVGIVPPKGKQLQLYQIRDFITELMRMGIGVQWIVSDSFQSTDTLQLMKKQGLETLMNSVDRKKDAYFMLRNAILEGRLKLPKNNILYKELVFLKEDSKKIDHPETNPDGTHGGKDLADSLANAIFVANTKMDFIPWLDTSFIDELNDVIDEGDSNPFEDVFGPGTTGNYVT